MKLSQLEMIVRKIIREELRSALPEMLSEMYVRKIVSEQHAPAPRQQVSAPKQRKQQAPQSVQKGRSKLAEQLMQEFDDGNDWYSTDEESEEQENFRSNDKVIPPNVIADRARALANSGPMGGLLAEMIDETTLQSINEDDEGVSIDAVPEFDFSRMRKVAQIAEQRVVTQQRDPDAEQRRIDMQRKMLDSKTVSSR